MKTATICFSCFLAFSSFAIAEETSPSSTLVAAVEQYPILTPALADRRVAKIILNNGIEAYLVSDPEIEQSAAAIGVAVGSWEDPKEYPGTAHFLEHMLFLGTSAYPGEAEYSKYIKENGGAVNAFTASDRTVYMFSINNEAFVGALDRFSHFFIDPLFTPSCINRELHAVDQEFAKNIEHDGWRVHMVLKETSIEGHPNTKFTTGNAATLSGIPQAALKQWYETHYSSDKMSLVMLSALPIEDMIVQAEEKFSAIPKREVLPATAYSPVFSSQQKGHFLYVAPVRDLKTLSLVWELPEEFSSIENKWSAELISYALTHGSEKSLLQALKNQNIAESVSASLDHLDRNTCLFCLDIELTEEGLSKIDTAIALSYEAIAKINQTGISLSLFQEIKTMAQLKYQYQSREEPFSWVMETTRALMDESLETFPEKTEVPSHFDPEVVMQLSSLLTPESCLYIVLANPDKLGIVPDRTETWMNVPYKIEPIAPAKLSNWKQTVPTHSIELPPTNPYLPTSLELLTKEGVSIKEPIPAPICVVKEDKIIGYFEQDDRYLVPESTFLFSVKSPSIDGSARAAVLTDLVTKALGDDLFSTIFFAAHAGLSCNFSAKPLSFDIQISGYSQQAPKLTQEVFSFVKTFTSSKEKFSIYKNSLLSAYANGAAELPVKQAMVQAYNILLSSTPTPAEKEAALTSISWEDFSDFLTHWLDQIYIESTLYGNLTKSEAKNLLLSINDLFNSAATYTNPLKQTVLQLPAEKGPFKITQKTERQGNGAVLVIEQGEFTFAKKASQKVLGVVLQEQFFDTLRTKQQTAYIAQAWASETDKQLLQLFAVQSSSHLPEDLLHRFELFLEHFCKQLTELVSLEQFQVIRQAQITALETPPDNIADMAAYLNILAFEKDADFAYKEQLITALRSLSYEDFLQATSEYLSKNNTKRLAVLMEGKQLPTKPLQYAEIAKEDIVKAGTYTSR